MLQRNLGKPFISIVIPIFSEEGNILELYRKLQEAIREVGRSYEIIFVNDGSSDRSIDLLEELNIENPRNILDAKRFFRSKAYFNAAGIGRTVGRG